MALRSRLGVLVAAGATAATPALAQLCPSVPAATPTGSTDEIVARAQAALASEQFAVAAELFAAVALEHSSEPAGS